MPCMEPPHMLGGVIGGVGGVDEWGWVGGRGGDVGGGHGLCGSMANMGDTGTPERERLWQRFVSGAPDQFPQRAPTP